VIDEAIAEVKTRTADDLDLRINTYNRLRDEMRDLEKRLAGMGHTQQGFAQKQVDEIQDQIRETTDWVAGYYDDILQSEYQQSILAIVSAKSVREDLRDALAEGDSEVIRAEEACYQKYVELRNASRAAGRPKPMRFDAPKPKSRSGQLSSWSPGLPS